MSKNPNEEVSELDLQQIAKSIEEGNTGGIIDTEESDGIYRISWKIEISKFKNE